MRRASCYWAWFVVPALTVVGVMAFYISRPAESNGAPASPPAPREGPLVETLTTGGGDRVGGLSVAVSFVPLVARTPEMGGPGVGRVFVLRCALVNEGRETAEGPRLGVRDYDHFECEVRLADEKWRQLNLLMTIDRHSMVWIDDDRREPTVALSPGETRWVRLVVWLSDAVATVIQNDEVRLRVGYFRIFTRTTHWSPELVVARGRDDDGVSRALAAKRFHLFPLTTRWFRDRPGDWKQRVRRKYEQFLAAHPNSSAVPVVRYGLANMLALTGEPREAARVLEDLRAACPNGAFAGLARARIGQVLLQSGDPTGALEALRRAESEFEDGDVEAEWVLETLRGELVHRGLLER